VFANISEERVKETIEDVGLGEVERVDVVPIKVTSGKKFNRVYVHFKRWSKSEEAQSAREVVLSGDMFEVTYEDPWFWKIGMSNLKKPEHRGKAGAKKEKSERPNLSIRTPGKSVKKAVKSSKSKSKKGSVKLHNSGPSETDFQLAYLKNEITLMRREMEKMRAELDEYKSGTPAKTVPYVERDYPEVGTPDYPPTPCLNDIVPEDHIAREAEAEAHA